MGIHNLVFTVLQMHFALNFDLLVSQALPRTIPSKIMLVALFRDQKQLFFSDCHVSPISSNDQRGCLLNKEFAMSLCAS